MTEKSEAEAFIRGAVMAYEDAAKWIADMSTRLPIEVAFLAPQFDEIATAMHNKAQNVKVEANEARNR